METTTIDRLDDVDNVGERRFDDDEDFFELWTLSGTREEGE